MTDTCKWYHVCPMKQFHEDGRLELFWINTYCKGGWDDCVRFKMEEEGREHSDDLMPDGSFLKK